MLFSDLPKPFFDVHDNFHQPVVLEGILLLAAVFPTFLPFSV